MKRFIVELDGQREEGWFEKIKGTLWVHWRGQTLTWEPKSSERKRSRDSDLHRGEILAPMPGKITKILKQEGESVKSGELVLVMEAMKMEYSLNSHRDGLIKKLKVSVGSQVELHQILVEVGS